MTGLVYPFLLSFVVTVILLPGYIWWLKKKQLSQFIRQEGPASHAGKARTPTTGGVAFIAAVVATFLILAGIGLYPDWLMISCLVLALLCSLIGLGDDLAKVRNKANIGLTASLRLKIEVLLGAIYGFGLTRFVPGVQKVLVLNLAAPHHSVEWQMPLWLFILLSVFLVAATTNAINLHDGMDGLAAGTTSLVLATMALMFAQTERFGLASLAATGAGSVLAFLIFNKHPAKIFMGDTGSLFLGGLIAALAMAGGLVIWFIPLTLIYIAETLSVILQVGYFKLTKSYEPAKPISWLALIWLKLTKRLPGEGKRLFRMAPLHHHFEAVLADRGIREGQVVAGFWFIQLLICATVLAAFSFD